MEFEEGQEDIEYLKQIIPYISAHLDWREFLLFCDFLSYEEKKQFKEHGDEKNSSSKIVQMILDRLMQKKDVKNKRQTLQVILEKMDSIKISKLLRRKQLPSKSKNKEKLNAHLSTICSQLKVEELLVYLRKKEVINATDVGVIKASLAAEGNWVAAFELMFRLSGRETHWFGKFIEALIETGQRQLAKTIDEDMCQKIEDNMEMAFRFDNPSCKTSEEQEPEMDLCDEYQSYKAILLKSTYS